VGDLIADVGNTRAHLAWVEAGRVEARAALETADRARARAAWETFLGARRPARVAYATVAAAAGAAFAAWAAEATGVAAVSLGTPGLPYPLPLDVAQPERVGPDRVANATWAVRAHPRQAVVVVDLGTAITFDVVSARGAFLGGAIACGLRLAAGALAAGTDLLPLGELGEEPSPALGKTTEACLAAGLWWGAIGLVEATCARIAAELGEAPRVVATGGDAPQVAPHCACVDAVVPDVTLLGVAYALDARDG